MELRRNIDDVLYSNQLMHVTNYVYKVGVVYLILSSFHVTIFKVFQFFTY